MKAEKSPLVSWLGTIVGSNVNNLHQDTTMSYLQRILITIPCKEWKSCFDFVYGCSWDVVEHDKKEAFCKDSKCMNVLHSLEKIWKSTIGFTAHL